MVDNSDKCERCEGTFTAGEIRRWRDECNFGPDDPDTTPRFCDECVDMMHVSTGDDVKDAVRAIERVRRSPKRTAREEALGVARAVGVPARLVDDGMVDSLARYGQCGPPLEEYAEVVVMALRHREGP